MGEANSANRQHNFDGRVRCEVQTAVHGNRELAVEVALNHRADLDDHTLVRGHAVDLETQTGAEASDDCGHIGCVREGDEVVTRVANKHNFAVHVVGVARSWRVCPCSAANVDLADANWAASGLRQQVRATGRGDTVAGGEGDVAVRLWRASALHSQTEDSDAGAGVLLEVRCEPVEAGGKWVAAVTARVDEREPTLCDGCDLVRIRANGVRQDNSEGVQHGHRHFEGSSRANAVRLVVDRATVNAQACCLDCGVKRVTFEAGDLVPPNGHVRFRECGAEGGAVGTNLLRTVVAHLVATKSRGDRYVHVARDHHGLRASACLVGCSEVRLHNTKSRRSGQGVDVGKAMRHTAHAGAVDDVGRVVGAKGTKSKLLTIKNIKVEITNCRPRGGHFEAERRRNDGEGV
eukprot:PhM_4_TR11705/c0_g1_i1/m.86026